ncbi:MAG TPA: arsenate reductase ArsC [Acidimicrobiales bacterium]|nr:arsenate reductase ArsC [Acidimicrobiales bacterium]
MTPISDAERTQILHEIAERLADEYKGVFGVETIEGFVKTSYDRFAAGIEPGDETAIEFLPRYTERFAREQLQGLAKSEGKLESPLPTVLFLCVRNAGRSQMALGWFQHLAGDRALAWSAGSAPGEEIDPNAVAAMAEVGIDIAREFPKPWTDEVVRGADVVVTMGCGDACPIVPGKRYEDWALTDPAGRSIEEVRPIRDEIGERVRDLLGRMGVSTAG